MEDGNFEEDAVQYKTTKAVKYPKLATGEHELLQTLGIDIVNEFADY